jgi:hypothetical protein
MADLDVDRWKKLVADFETSDLTQREFASERGVSFSNLRNWIYRLRKETRPLVETAPASPRQAARREPDKGGSRLVPVHVVASAPKARLVEASAALLELALPSGVALRFPPGTDPSYLRALVAAL